VIPDLQVLRPAAEGVALARHPDGRVVLVRYALPGEVVDVVVTGAGKGGRFLRADAIEVKSASSGRVDVVCQHAHPGGCGGCDLLFATPEFQRRWKSDVLADQLRRIAGLDLDVVVEPVGAGAATGWRTRVRFGVDADGRLGMRGARSHDIVPVNSCAQTVPAIAELELGEIRLPGAKSVVIAAGDEGVVAAVWPTEFASALAEQLPEAISVVGVRGSDTVLHSVHDFEWSLPPDGFWQVHPDATLTLAEAVRDGLRPKAGDHLLDLYAGAGLFASVLADDLGPGGRIDAVEANGSAVLAGSDTLAEVGILKWHVNYVDAWLKDRSSAKRADLVVLDPPRTGAGVEVMKRIVDRSPRTIVYVACDPATFARDLKAILELGWKLSKLRAFDLFPSTAHTELVATLVPGSRP
jgi:tRNA/tmRNA/rRNA uracil-C5-methylase (TrmA/RlmC/RlmD family)